MKKTYNKENKSKEIDIKKIALEVIKIKAERPYIRAGQATFNISWELYHKEANMLRSSWYDCFYDDSKITVFIEALVTLRRGGTLPMLSDKSLLEPIK